jgi:hypothetical protein
VAGPACGGDRVWHKGPQPVRTGGCLGHAQQSDHPSGQGGGDLGEEAVLAGGAGHQYRVGGPGSGRGKSDVRGAEGCDHVDAVALQGLPGGDDDGLDLAILVWQSALTSFSSRA